MGILSENRHIHTKAFLQDITEFSYFSSQIFESSIFCFIFAANQNSIDRGDRKSPFLLPSGNGQGAQRTSNNMKTAEEIKTITNSLLENSDLFLVNITVSGDNDIEVLIDSPSGVGITTCMEISRQLEQKLDRDTEDFALTVASAGIGYPFLVEGQYRKNIGNAVEIRLKDAGLLKGVLKAFEQDHILVECEEKKSVEGKKKKETVKTEKTVLLSDIKQIKDIVTF